LVHFTEEEAVILKRAIESIDDTNLLKQNLKRKLYSVYDNKILADTIVQGSAAATVHSLIEAIESRQQVVLLGYRSAHGSAVRDRKVEPFAFTTNYVQVWCYDCESHSCKLFKTSRIGRVEILDSEWQYAESHTKGFIDIFRMNGEKRLPITLSLGLMARNLLVEEYPLAEKLLTERDGRWILSTEVADYAGVTRFVVGLLDDIKIIDSPDLETYIARYVERFWPHAIGR
jgi:predicted DNA-binding transcriptional regulator YafY